MRIHNPPHSVALVEYLVVDYLVVDDDRVVVIDDDRVVVIGRYWGSARNGDTSVDAAFVHVITTRGDSMAALRQITDTARWRIPCR